MSNAISILLANIKKAYQARSHATWGTGRKTLTQAKEIIAMIAALTAVPK